MYYWGFTPNFKDLNSSLYSSDINEKINTHLSYKFTNEEFESSYNYNDFRRLNSDGNNENGDQHDIYNNSWFDIYDIGDLGQSTQGLTSADFNKDSYIDFAVSSSTSPFSYSTISIFYNNGQLGFTRDDVYTFYYSYIRDLDSGDYDNDGDIDFLFTYSEYEWINGDPIRINGTINILYNDGNNNFGDLSMIAKRGTGIPFDSEGRINPKITSADYDGDGDIDFLAGDNSGKVEYFLNNGTGNFTSAGIIYDFGSVSWGLTSADFDGDNDIDFLVSAVEKGNENCGHVYIKRNNGLSSCFENNSGEIIADLYSEFTLATGSLQSLDYDNDGDIDFLLGMNNMLYLYFNNEDIYEYAYLGELPDNQEGHADALTGGGLTSADYNNDGEMDFITGGVQGVIRVFVNREGPWIFIMRPQQDFRYIFDNEEICPILHYPSIVGKITVIVKGCQDLNKVEFYIDNRLRKIDTAPPYTWTWRFGIPLYNYRTIKVVGYDPNGNNSATVFNVYRSSILYYLLTEIFDS